MLFAASEMSVYTLVIMLLYYRQIPQRVFSDRESSEAKLEPSTLSSVDAMDMPPELPKPESLLENGIDWASAGATTVVGDVTSDDAAPPDDATLDLDSAPPDGAAGNSGDESRKRTHVDFVQEMKHYAYIERWIVNRRDGEALRYLRSAKRASLANFVLHAGTPADTKNGAN
eukprot:IDg853t1